MSPTNEQPDALERSIDRLLREQPPVRAPRTLESRVLAEIGRHAARPWWQLTFVHWPPVARAVFVAASLVIVKFVLDAVMWVVTGLRTAPVTQALDASVEKVHVARSVLTSFADIGTYLLNGIPSFWLYAAALGSVAAYVIFLGLGALAYKALYK